MQKYVGVFFLFMWCLPAFAEESVELSETLSELPLAFVTENTPSEVAISYSWGDFLMGKSCQEDFNKLQNKPFLTEAESNILTDACKIFTLKDEDVYLVEGEVTNIKITYPYDLKLANTILEDRND